MYMHHVIDSVHTLIAEAGCKPFSQKNQKMLGFFTMPRDECAIFSYVSKRQRNVMLHGYL